MFKWILTPCETCIQLEGVLMPETEEERHQRMVATQQRCVLIPVVIDEDTDMIDVILAGSDEEKVDNA